MISTLPRRTHEWKNLGQNLARARNLRKLTQAELAALSGIDQAIISRFESAHRWPTLVQLTKLAKALRVSFQWFIDGSNWPGRDIRDIVIELQGLGIVDLFAEAPVIPGAFRAPEEVLSLALSGDRPESRIVEAIPAALAWGLGGVKWDIRLLKAYGQRYDRRAGYRIAWLADVALTIHESRGFPGGCPNHLRLSQYVKRITPPRESDSLGRPAASATALPPVSKRWNITYASDLTTFRKRAEHLRSVLDRSDDHPEGDGP